MTIYNNRQVLEPYYKALFEKWSVEFAKILPCLGKKLTQVDWDAACRYACCLSHSIKGIPLKDFIYAHSQFSIDKPKFLIVLKHIQRLAEYQADKFRHVRFYNDDAINIIKQQDADDTFFLLDPGYFTKEYYYRNRGKKPTKSQLLTNGIMPDDLIKHEELSFVLQNIRGMFMLCYEYHEELERLYPRNCFTWIFKEYHRPAAIGRKACLGKIKPGTEILIVNYGEELNRNPKYKEHLIESAKAILPPNEDTRSRASYSPEFKRRVIRMMDSKLFTKKEVMNTLGIGSYNTLSRWENQKLGIETTCILLEQAAKYSPKSKPEDTKVVPRRTNRKPRVRAEVKEIIGGLRFTNIVSNKYIRTIFGVDRWYVETCYQGWYKEVTGVAEYDIKVDKLGKIQQPEVFLYQMAA